MLYEVITGLKIAFAGILCNTKGHISRPEVSNTIVYEVSPDSPEISITGSLSVDAGGQQVECRARLPVGAAVSSAEDENTA